MGLHKQLSEDLETKKRQMLEIERRTRIVEVVSESIKLRINRGW